MASYSSDYKYTTNAGPPSTGEGDDQQATLQATGGIFNTTRATDRGRATVPDSVVAHNSFLARLGTLNDGYTDANESDELRYAFGTIYSSTADDKVTDTRAGGQVGVGGAPQFTRYSDVRSKGLIASRREVTTGNHDGEIGMGRIYDETVESPQELLYLQFGVPMFNSLSGFLTKFSDTALTKLATTGKAEGFMYKAGQVAGVVFTVRMLGPWWSLLGGSLWAASYFFANRTSRFYVCNPQMALYWSSVNTLVNKLVINRGILPRTRYDDKVEQDSARDLIGNLSEMMPGLFHPTRGVDVPAIISIAHRRTSRSIKRSLAISNAIVVENKGDKIGANAFLDSMNYDSNGNLITRETTLEVDPEDTDDETNSGRGSLTKMITVLSKYKWNQASTGGTGSINANMAMKPVGMTEGDAYLNDGTANTKSTAEEDTLRGKTPEEAKTAELSGARITNRSYRFSEDRENEDTEGYLGTLEAYARDGADWAVFRVNHIDTVTESFTNQTSANTLGSGLNQASSTARSIKYSFAGGNIGDNQIVNGLEGAISGISDFAAGAIDTLSFGLVGSVFDLLRGVNVEVPNYWESSSAEISTSTFTMDLLPPYNNIYSHIQSIYIPLCMLAAGMWPVKSGAQSHVSPFVCKSHLLGKNKSALSMIKSLSIERGTTHLPFDLKGHALGVKVTFSLVNLSPSISSPISLSSVFRPSEWALDEDSSVYEYMEMLAGMTLEEQSLSLQSIRVRIASGMRSISRLTDGAAWAALTHQYALNIPLVGNLYQGLGGITSNNALMRAEQNR